MGESKPVVDIEVPMLKCPVCKKEYSRDQPMYAYACSPPITVYPCGCRVRYKEVDTLGGVTEGEA